MSLIRKTSEFDLDEREIEYARSAAVHEEVRSFLARQRDNLGVKTTFNRKVAAAARAEREALIEIRALEIVKGENTAVEDARRDIARLQRERDHLEARVGAQEAQITELIARPARAINSGE